MTNRDNNQDSCNVQEENLLAISADGPETTPKDRNGTRNKPEEIHSNDDDEENVHQSTAQPNNQLPTTQLDTGRQRYTSKQSLHKDVLVENREPKLLSDSELKNIGNRLCSLCRYDDAIIYYGHAISKNPNVAIYYSNRALCYLKLQQWNQTICDCRRALELEPNLIKAHFFYGQALAETLNFDDALKHLERAHELAKERKMNFGDDIAYQIRLVKRLRWTKSEDDNSRFEDELHNYLNGLIELDKQRRLNLLIEQKQSLKTVEDSWKTKASTSTKQQPEDLSTRSVGQLELEEQAIISRCDNYSDKLVSMFNDLKLRRKKRDVPEYLCGKISFEIMRDPVITPSGITYDRQDIEEHLRRVGYFDPITRQPLKVNQLISNLAMKEVVDAYLDENEWALHQ